MNPSDAFQNKVQESRLAIFLADVAFTGVLRLCIPVLMSHAWARMEVHRPEPGQVWGSDRRGLLGAGNINPLSYSPLMEFPILGKRFRFPALFPPITRRHC